MEEHKKIGKILAADLEIRRMDFLIGGTAATCAGVFSNPFDVIKTRQQLQGELQKRKHVQKAKQMYSNQWQAIKNIVKAEGMAGLQKGKHFKSIFDGFPFIKSSIVC